MHGRTLKRFKPYLDSSSFDKQPIWALFVPTLHYTKLHSYYIIDATASTWIKVFSHQQNLELGTKSFVSITSSKKNSPFCFFKYISKLFKAKTENFHHKISLNLIILN